MTIFRPLLIQIPYHAKIHYRNQIGHVNEPMPQSDQGSKIQEAVKGWA